MFGTEPFLVETFIDASKYKGTCYKAANWLYLGQTKGFSKVGKEFVYHGNKKGVFVYVLNSNFKSKTQIASDLINKTISSGLFPAKWIGCDSFFGTDKNFLDSMPEECYYFADIRSTTSV